MRRTLRGKAQVCKTKFLPLLVRSRIQQFQPSEAGTRGVLEQWESEVRWRNDALPVATIRVSELHQPHPMIPCVSRATTFSLFRKRAPWGCHIGSILRSSDSLCKLPALSKAFTKEEDDIPERASRARSSSGLPPGAVNYLTADGAVRLRAELGQVPEGSERAAELAGILASATVVNPPAEPPECAVFGAWMELRAGNGEVRRHRITGADEAGTDQGSVSWASPLGRKLLGKEIGGKVELTAEGEPRKFTVVRIWY